MIMRKPLQTRENGVNWEQQKSGPRRSVYALDEGLAHHFDSAKEDWS